MIIKTASFIKSINGTDKILYDGKFQIAFVGRSNVGKSSVINSLVQQKLARSSKAPGKTKHLDFFLINNKVYFVDLPGYGFAHTSSQERERYRKMMMWYVEYANIQRRLFVHIVDSFVGLTEFDRQMVEYLSKIGVPFIIIANKIDKVPNQERTAHLEEIAKICQSEYVIPYSAKTHEGRINVLKTFDKYL